MALQHDVELLDPQVRVSKLSRSSISVWLYANPLGQACYKLDQAKAESGLADLRRSGTSFMTQGLTCASELRPVSGHEQLAASERRHFLLELGCPALLLVCHGCGHELLRLREGHASQDAPSRSVGSDKGARSQKEREVQVAATKIIELLLQSGARISAQDVGPQGNTALHLAARYGAHQLLSALLRMGASISVRNNDGSTAEIIAERVSDTRCVQILQVAAMIERDKIAADEKELAESQERECQKKKRIKERRRGKKKEESAAAKAAEGRPANSYAHLQDSSEEDSSEEEHGQVEAPSKLGAAYGRKSMWSALHEDYCLDDAELPDEWDEETWGEYVDWGEDWDAEAQEGDEPPESPLSDDDEEDDHEVRAELLRLRSEKAMQLEQIYSYASEREERMQQAEVVDDEACILAEAAKRLKKRKALQEAGDESVKADFAAEAEVSAWWEEMATAHALAIFRLQTDLVKLKKSEQETLRDLHKQLQEVRRRTKGLEEYWDCYCKSQSTNELLEILSAQNRSKALADELQRMTDLLEIPPEAKARLPVLWLPHPTGDGRVALPQTAYLLEAAKLHKALHEGVRSQEQRFTGMLAICNKNLADKDEELLGEVEEELWLRVLPKASIASGREAWAQLSKIVSYSLQALEQTSSSSQGHIPPDAGFR